MKIVTKLAGLAVALTMVAGAAGMAVAESPHDGAVKARQGDMRLRAFNLGILGAMAKGKIEYDAKAASAAAYNLKVLSTLNASALWPQGSDAGAYGDKTTASAELWKNFPKVIEAAKAFNAAATVMEAAAGKDLASLQGAMGGVGKSCGGCHKPFRVKKE